MITKKKIKQTGNKYIQHETHFSIQLWHLKNVNNVS